MLEQFKEKGRCVTMESAYMSGIMALIGLFEWSMNMVGNAKVNQTRADTKATIAQMNKHKENHKSNL